MDDLRFAWDSEKNEKNIKKHKITFEEASTVFFDEGARVIADPDHMQEEDRFIILGMSSEAKQYYGFN